MTENLRPKLREVLIQSRVAEWIVLLFVLTALDSVGTGVTGFFNSVDVPWGAIKRGLEGHGFVFAQQSNMLLAFKLFLLSSATAFLVFVPGWIFSLVVFGTGPLTVLRRFSKLMEKNTHGSVEGSSAR